MKLSLRIMPTKCSRNLINTTKQKKNEEKKWTKKMYENCTLCHYNDLLTLTALEHF